MPYIVVHHEALDEGNNNVYVYSAGDDKALAESVAERLTKGEYRFAQDNGGYPGSATVYKVEDLPGLAEVIAELDEADAERDFAVGDEVEFLGSSPGLPRDTWLPGTILEVGSGYLAGKFMVRRHRGNRPVDPGRAWMNRETLRRPQREVDAA